MLSPADEVLLQGLHGLVHDIVERVDNSASLAGIKPAVLDEALDGGVGVKVVCGWGG